MNRDVVRPTARSARRSPARQGDSSGTRAGSDSWRTSRVEPTAEWWTSGCRGWRSSVIEVRSPPTNRPVTAPACCFPIPRRLLGHAARLRARRRGANLGLLMLFISDKRSPGEVCAAVEDACGRERLRDRPLAETFRSIRRRLATTHAPRGPRILQAVLRAPARRRARAVRAACASGAPPRSTRSREPPTGTSTWRHAASPPSRTRRSPRRTGWPSFYPDLRDPDVEAPFVVFHQRYSTNTAPTWERAQPFRMLCHNGEINTIAGNANRMHAREGSAGPRDARGGSALPSRDRRCRLRLGDPRRDGRDPHQGGRRRGGRPRHPPCDRDARPGCVGGRARTWTRNGVAFYRWHAS